MDKLTAIKIKYDDGTYSDEIPVSVLSENVEWDSTHTLVDVLGSIDVDVTGTIQDQISQLFNEKVSAPVMQDYVTNSMPTYITNWLNTNVNPVGSAVVVDSSLTVSGAAADAKKTGDELSALKGEAIGAINLPFTLTNKKVIDGNEGVERAATAAYYASSFIDVSMASKIEVFSAFHNHFTYAFYNINQQFISGLAQTPSEYNDIAHKYVVTVPPEAKYFRFTVVVTSTSGVTTDTAYVKTVFDNLIELTNEMGLKADKTYVDNLVGASTYLPFTTENAKAVYGTNGEVITANTNYYLTSMIELPECYTLEFYTAFHNNFGGAFYDENQTFISGVTYADGYNDLAHVYTVSVPEGAKYFRFTILATTITGIFVGQAYIKTIVKNITELEGEIKTVE